jgi:membrane-associated phospholipid phosphatase
MFIILAIFLALAAGLVYLFVQFIVYFLYFCLAVLLLLVLVFSAAGMPDDVVGWAAVITFGAFFLWFLTLGDEKPKKEKWQQY